MVWEDDITIVDEVTGDPISLSGVDDLFLYVRDDYNTDVLVRLSLTDGTLVLVDGGTGGKFGIRMSSAQTLDFPANDHEQARYVYDTVIERTAESYEPGVAGALTVDPVVARAWEPTS